MDKRKSLSIVLIFTLFLCFNLTSCGNIDTAPSAVTLNPVLNFYINRTFNTDASTVIGYGTDSSGVSTSGTTGSQTGFIAGPPAFNYQNYFKLLFNFNISALSGTTVKSANFRIYLNGVSGTDTPSNAILDNIFYGNTDSFPAPRNSDNEFGGYTIAPAISGTAVATTVGWIQIDVTEKLQADIDAGRTNSQFRLSHENPASLFNFLCSWNLVGNATNKPELVITYTSP